MVRRLALGLFFVSLSSCVFGSDETQTKIAKLDSNSIELLGVSILELHELLKLRQGIISTSVDYLEEGGTFTHLKVLEEKGYITINKVTTENTWGFPFDENTRSIALKRKGRNIVDAFERYQYNK